MNWMKKIAPYKIPLFLSATMLSMLFGYQNCVEVSAQKKGTSKAQAPTGIFTVGGNGGGGSQEEWITIYAQSSTGTAVYHQPEDLEACDYRLEIQAGAYSHVFESVSSQLPFDGLSFDVGGLELFNYLEGLANQTGRNEITFDLDLSGINQPATFLPEYILGASQLLGQSLTEYSLVDFLDVDADTVITLKESCVVTGPGNGPSTL